MQKLQNELKKDDKKGTLSNKGSMGASPTRSPTTSKKGKSLLPFLNSSHNSSRSKHTSISADSQQSREESFDSSMMETGSTTSSRRLFDPSSTSVLAGDALQDLKSKQPLQFFAQDMHGELISVDPADEKKILVEAATLPQLVNRLIAATVTDTTFAHDIFLTYTNYTDSYQLFNLIKDRFKFEAPDSASEDEKKKYKDFQPLVVARTLNSIKVWIECNSREFKRDTKFAEEVVEFIKGSFNEGMCKNLLQVFDKNIMHNVIDEQVFSESPPHSILPDQRITCLSDVPPLELARQLCLYESQFLRNIAPGEINHAQWTGQHRTTRAPNVVKLTDWFNKLTYWIATDVLSEPTSEERAKRIEYWIDVGSQCKQLNNFNSCQEVISALQMYVVLRCKRTWGLVNAESKKTLQGLKDLLSDLKSYAAYRARLNELLIVGEFAVLPFLGIHLRDILFLTDGNPNEVLVDTVRKISLHDFDTEASETKTETFSEISNRDVSGSDEDASDEDADDDNSGDDDDDDDENDDNHGHHKDSNDTGAPESGSTTPTNRSSPSFEAIKKGEHSSPLHPESANNRVTMVNFAKQRMIGQVVRTVQQCQRLAFNFLSVPEIEELFSSYDKICDDDSLWKLSESYNAEEKQETPTNNSTSTSTTNTLSSKAKLTPAHSFSNFFGIQNSLKRNPASRKEKDENKQREKERKKKEKEDLKKKKEEKKKEETKKKRVSLASSSSSPQTAPPEDEK